MTNLTTKIDLSGALRKLEILRSEQPKAIIRALNKTSKSARAQAAREIVGVGYGMKIAGIKKAISIRRATRAELTAIVQASGKPIPLINYSARQTKAGVSVAVLNGRTTITGAFIATMPSGHKGVYLRVGSATEKRMVARGAMKITKGRKIAYKHGLPIRQLFGPSVPNAFVNKLVQEAVIRTIRERFGVVLEQELRYIALH
jgi:minor tail protein Z (GPZ)